LQTQKWVPNNSPHLTRNGVVSPFLNPQWLEGKSRKHRNNNNNKSSEKNDKFQRRRYLKRRRAYESEEENFRYPPGITRGKKTRSSDVLGTIFVVFPTKIWKLLGIIYLFFSKIINSTMFGIFGKFNFLLFCFLISKNWENNHASNIPQLNATVGPLEQVGYPLVRCHSREKKLYKK